MQKRGIYYAAKKYLTDSTDSHRYKSSVTFCVICEKYSLRKPFVSLVRCGKKTKQFFVP
jgi:hypothetical protein